MNHEKNHDTWTLDFDLMHEECPRCHRIKPCGRCEDGCYMCQSCYQKANGMGDLPSDYFSDPNYKSDFDRFVKEHLYYPHGKKDHDIDKDGTPVHDDKCKVCTGCPATDVSKICYCRKFKQNGSCVHRPSTDVSWEVEYDKLVGLVMVGNAETYPNHNKINPQAIKGFIRLQKQLSFDAGGKTVGGTGRVMFMKGYEEGFENGKQIERKKAIAEIRGQIEKLLEAENRQSIRIKYITEDKALNTEFDIALKAVLSLEALSNK